MMNAKVLGTITVDAGCVYIGDPCYVLHKEGDKRPKALKESWFDLVQDMFKPNEGFTKYQLNHDLGHPGLGIIVPTYLGDGEYEVIGLYWPGEIRPAAIFVDFSGVLENRFNSLDIVFSKTETYGNEI